MRPGDALRGPVEQPRCQPRTAGRARRTARGPAGFAAPGGFGAGKDCQPRQDLPAVGPVEGRGPRAAASGGYGVGLGARLTAAPELACNAGGEALSAPT
jgi:hypothetical protein